MLCRTCLILQNTIKDNQDLKDACEIAFARYSMPEDKRAKIRTSLEEERGKLISISSEECRDRVCRLMPDWYPVRE